MEESPGAGKSIASWISSFGNNLSTRWSHPDSATVTALKNIAAGIGKVRQQLRNIKNEKLKRVGEIALCNSIME